MTPAERDDVRMFARLTLASDGASKIERMEAAAILRYVPPGVCIEIDTKALPVEFATVGIRNAAHAIHAAADAAEES